MYSLSTSEWFACYNEMHATFSNGKNCKSGWGVNSRGTTGNKQTNKINLAKITK